MNRRPRLVAGLAAIVLGTAAMAAVVAWALLLRLKCSIQPIGHEVGKK